MERTDSKNKVHANRLPRWFTQRLPNAEETLRVRRLLAESNLHTVCVGAHCPNIGQCFSDGTATFMILGDICTRNCTFCAVSKGIPLPIDTDEPSKIADAVKRLGLNYVVITCVTRDDIDDGGAEHFANTIRAIHTSMPNTRVEVLVSDFNNNQKSIKVVINASPEVFAHNLETVPRLYPDVRPMADYKRSLHILMKAKDLNPKIVTKSAIMLGLGENHAEIIQVMKDLREIKCDLLSLGQYLAPTERHHPIVEFVTPEQFSEYQKIGLSLGFKGVTSAPLVRSSFKAGELYESAQKD